MKKNSLSLRLLIAASISVILALIATGFVFSFFFKGQFEDRIKSELATHLLELTANIEIDSQGQFKIFPLSDQRFDQPFSGLYWQIDQNETKPLHSRSLWDISLELTTPSELGQQESQRVKSDGFDLMVLSWIVTIGPDDAPLELTLSVATDYNQIQIAADKFNKNLFLWLSLLAVALIFAAWLQVRIGLQPLEALRAELNNIRSGSAKHLRNNFPAEVAPLVNEVNDLLDNQQENLAQARGHAGDLAHGLKTPLTVMRALAQQIRNGEMDGLADDIDAQTEAMDHFVKRELARSRIRLGTASKSELLPVVTRMVNAISRLPTEQVIDWQIDIPAGSAAPIDEFDLSEMLGNLLDNAREWTRDKIVVSARTNGTKKTLSITDNGPGVAESQLSEVLERGMRTDKNRPGSGLGLAIVQDIVSGYGFDLTLKNNKTGGLCVTISWS